MSVPRAPRPVCVDFATFRRPTRRGLRGLLWDALRDVVAGIAADIRETLPTEDTAGVWVAGFAWGLVLFVLILLVVTIGWARAHGVAL